MCPANNRVRADTYSKSKYASVISQSGGWDWFQMLLRELDGVARKHGADIATVASRWVLDQPQVYFFMAVPLCGRVNHPSIPLMRTQ